MDFTKYFIFLSCMSFSAWVGAEELDPSQLIKVNKENNPKCVEYYDIEGEMYCSTKLLKQQNLVNDEVVKAENWDIQFDGRKWIPAWTEKNDMVTTIEYIPQGDKLENWHELITTNYLPDVKKSITPKDIMDGVVENLTNNGFNPKVTVHQSSADQIIFEFQIVTPENMQQDEIQKIVRTSEGYYILHYVIKKADMGEEARKTWLTNLKESSLDKEDGQEESNDGDEE